MRGVFATAQILYVYINDHVTYNLYEQATTAPLY